MLWRPLLSICTVVATCAVGECHHMLDARADREWENWQKEIALEGRRVANPE
jgi:hypothetical protein